MYRDHIHLLGIFKVYQVSGVTAISLASYGDGDYSDHIIMMLNYDTIYY